MAQASYESLLTINRTDMAVVIPAKQRTFRVNVVNKPAVVHTVPGGPRGIKGDDGAYASPTATDIEDGTEYEVPAGKQLHSIAVVPASGARVLTVGYSAGAGEVIDEEDVDSDDSVTFPINKYYHAGITLHFSGFTGSVLIYVL